MMSPVLAVVRVYVMALAEVLGRRVWRDVAAATDLCIDLHAVDATSAGRAMLTSLVVTKKTASDAIVVMVFVGSARGGSTR